MGFSLKEEEAKDTQTLLFTAAILRQKQVQEACKTCLRRADRKSLVTPAPARDRDLPADPSSTLEALLQGHWALSWGCPAVLCK